MNNCNTTIWFSGRLNRPRGGFSLLEIMAVLIIITMVTLSALAVFNGAQKASASISSRLDRNDAAMEVLQRVAEDLDRLAKPGHDIKLTVANKVVDEINKSQLTIQSDFYGKDGKSVIFEKVVWQTQYDEFDDMLIIYRAHFGINLDDKILSVAEIQRPEAEQKPFVPVCAGMTFFEFTVPQEGSYPLRRWVSKTLPPAITVAMSFALPTELETGEFAVLEEDKEIRTIAIDRTKDLKFIFVRQDFEIEDPKTIDETADPNDIGNTDNPDNLDRNIDPGDTDEPADTRTTKPK